MPVALYIAFIFWLSSAPRPVPGFLRWPGGDKLFHAVEYLPLGCLLLRAFYHSLGKGSRRVPAVILWGVSALAALGVGALDEFYQSFISERFSSAADVIADLIGSGVGQWLYAKWTRTP